MVFEEIGMSSSK